MSEELEHGDIVAEVEHKGVSVTFEWHGEGYSGDYSGAPDDDKLLRFYVNDETDQGRDEGITSCCTQIAWPVPEENLEAVAKAMCVDFATEVSAGVWESLAEEYSWLSNEDVVEEAEA